MPVPDGYDHAVRVLLLPGFDGTGKLFAPLQSILARQVDITVVSYRYEAEFSDYVDTVASLLPENNAVLVAESFSGPVSLALMARYPERIRGAVLCATFATSPFRALTRLARFVPAAFFGPAPTQRLALRKFCFESESEPELMTKALSVIRSVPAATIKQRLRVLATIDMRPLLPRISLPVLYLQAMQDKLVSSHLSRQLVAGLPNIRVRRLSGPHLLLQCRPVQCAEAIMSYIGDLERNPVTPTT